MRDMCDANPDCFGIQKYPDMNKGFLMKRECMLEALNGMADSTTFTYYAKMDPESAGGEGCPMGMAVLAEGFDDPYDICEDLTEVEQYNPIDAKTFGTECSAISWSPNGCGWLVQAPPKPTPPEPPALASCPHSTCVDKVVEANWIFGFEGEGYDEEICSRTEPWLAAPGYCQNALWKALCPDVTCAVCGTWMNDNVDAADVLTSMLKLEVDRGAGSCAALKAANMCEDPVVSVVCIATCPAGVRRLTAETQAHLESMRHVYGTKFREELAVLEQAAIAAGGRRLSDAPMTTLLGSWDPTVRPGICANTAESSTAPANYDLITMATMWDWYGWINTKYDIDITPSCPLQATYDTASSLYCDDNNMNIMGIDAGDGPGQPTEALKSGIVADLCWKKCLAPGTSVSGAADPMCAGMDPAFNSYSNALCVTRDTCESYCDALGGGCIGFEMHKTVPRCYLITSPCGDDVIASDKYDQVTKSEGLIRYKTYDGKTCDIKNFATSTMVGDREDCEEFCSADKSCGGFAYTVATKTCEFTAVPSGSFRASGYCSGGGMTYAATSPTEDTLDAAPGTSFVEKVLAGFSVEQPWSPPCSAVVSAGPGLIPGTAIGTYERKEAVDCGAPAQGVVCYMSPTGLFRLIWGN